MHRTSQVNIISAPVMLKSNCTMLTSYSLKKLQLQNQIFFPSLSHIQFGNFFYYDMERYCDGSYLPIISYIISNISKLWCFCPVCSHIFAKCLGKYSVFYRICLTDFLNNDNALAFSESYSNANRTTISDYNTKPVRGDRAILF